MIPGREPTETATEKQRNNFGRLAPRQAQAQRLSGKDVLESEVIFKPARSAVHVQWPSKIQ